MVAFREPTKKHRLDCLVWFNLVVGSVLVLCFLCEANMMRSDEDTDQGLLSDAGSDSAVRCTVCLELVDCGGARSTAKLQCGHEFHLDCIGSAFNMKGTMQCPNCRGVEQGQWLYSTGSTNFDSGHSTDSWVPEQHPFLILPVGFRFCPFPGVTEMDDLSIHGPDFYGYHDNFGEQLLGFHDNFGEHILAQPSPGFSYFAFGPHPAVPLNPNHHVVYGPSFTPSDNTSRQNFISHTFPPVGMRYQTPGHYVVPPPPTSNHIIDAHLGAATGLRISAPPFSSTQRPAVGSGGFSPPLAVHQGPDTSVIAVGGVQAASFIHHNPPPLGAAALPFHPAVRRPNGNGFPASGRMFDPTARFRPPRLTTTGYNPHATQNPIPNHFHAWGGDVHTSGVPFARFSGHWHGHQ